VGDLLRWSRDTLYPQKLALTSPTCGGRLVGIIRLRTKTTELTYAFYAILISVATICSINKLRFGGLVLNSWRSQWPSGLRHEPSFPARTLESWVRIPLEPWISVCVYSVFVLSCVQVAALRRADLPVQGVLPTVYRIKDWKSGQGPKGCRATERLYKVRKQKLSFSITGQVPDRRWSPKLKDWGCNNIVLAGKRCHTSRGRGAVIVEYRAKVEYSSATEKQRNLERTSTGASSSFEHLIWSQPGLNRAVCREKSTSMHHSYGTTSVQFVPAAFYFKLYMELGANKGTGTCFYLFLLCVLTPCNTGNSFRHFRGTHSLHLQGVNDDNGRKTGYTVNGHGILWFGHSS
jgi:hypothetical protein